MKALIVLLAMTLPTPYEEVVDVVELNCVTENEFQGAYTQVVLWRKEKAWSYCPMNWYHADFESAHVGPPNRLGHRLLTIKVQEKRFSEDRWIQVRFKRLKVTKGPDTEMEHRHVVPFEHRHAYAPRLLYADPYAPQP